MTPPSLFSTDLEGVFGSVYWGPIRVLCMHGASEDDWVEGFWKESEWIYRSISPELHDDVVKLVLHASA